MELKEMKWMSEERKLNKHIWIIDLEERMLLMVGNLFKIEVKYIDMRYLKMSCYCWWLFWLIFVVKRKRFSLGDMIWWCFIIDINKHNYKQLIFKNFTFYLLLSELWLSFFSWLTLIIIILIILIVLVSVFLCNLWLNEFIFWCSSFLVIWLNFCFLFCCLQNEFLFLYRILIPSFIIKNKFKIHIYSSLTIFIIIIIHKIPFVSILKFYFFILNLSNNIMIIFFS